MSIWDLFGRRPQPTSPPRSPEPAEPLPTPANDLGRHVRLLSARNELVRATAAEDLGALGADAAEAVPELLVASADTEPAVRQAARDALRRVMPEWAKHPAVERAVPTLVERLSSPFTDVWQTAAAHLRQIGPAAVEGVTDALADDTRPELQVQLLRVLTHVGPPASASAWVVARLLRSTQSHVRGAAAEALAGQRTCPADSVPELVAALSDRAAPTRCAAARAVAACGVHEEVAARALLPLLLDGTREVHDTAAEAVKTLGPVAAGLLTDFLSNNSFDFAERWVDECLRVMDAPTFYAQWRSRSSDLVVVGRDEKQLEELRRNADTAIANRKWGYAEAEERAAAWDRAREAALRGLAAVGPPPNSLPHLTAALESPTRGVRAAAVLALGRLGANARPAVPALVHTFLTASEPVRKGIRDALPAIDPEWRRHPDLGGAADKLIQHLSGVAETAEVAAEAIRFVGPAAVPGLLAALAVRDRTRQERAATLLGEVGVESAEVLPALDAVAADPSAHGWVRAAAKTAAERLRATPPV